MLIGYFGIFSLMKLKLFEDVLIDMFMDVVGGCYS